jgi:hypothetical protein
MTLRIKLLVIIHADKIKIKKNEINFSPQNLKFLLEPLALKLMKSEGHLFIYLHQIKSLFS